MHNPGCPPSSLSSIVDEVFALEKGTSLPPFSVPNLASSYSSPGSHLGAGPINLPGMKAGASSPKWDGGMQISQINVPKVSSVATQYGGSLYSSGNMKGSMQSSSLSSLSSVTVRSAAGNKLSASKSDQDLASLRSPHSPEVSSGISMYEDPLRLLSASSKEALSGSRTSRLLSPPRPTCPPVAASSSKPNGPRSSPTGPLTGSSKAAGSSSWVSSPTCKLTTLNSPVVTGMYVFSTRHFSFWFTIFDGKVAFFQPKHQIDRIFIAQVIDQHFRDLWELQKRSGQTSWGSGVRIANTSDIDYHIRYDPAGVVLSYTSVEADSIKKLVADIQRLSNARMFALGMRKLLGVRTEEEPE